MSTYVCVSVGKKCSLFGKFGVFCFLETTVLSFALLPYYRRLNLLKRNGWYAVLIIRKRTSVVNMKDFSCKYNWRSLDSISIWYKNPSNSLCIDLILKTSRRTFGSSCAIETGFSDFHKMIITVMTLHKKWSFPLRASSVNVTKSAVSCGFGYIYGKKP